MTQPITDPAARKRRTGEPPLTAQEERLCDWLALLHDEQRLLDTMDEWSKVEGWPERSRKFIKALYAVLNRQRAWGLEQLGQEQLTRLEDYLR